MLCAMGISKEFVIAFTLGSNERLSGLVKIVHYRNIFYVQTDSFAILGKSLHF